MSRLAGEGDASGIAFGGVAGLAVAPDGTVFASDARCHRILAIAPDGTVTVAAGTPDGDAGFTGDNVPANGSRLKAPQALLVEADTGVVFFADSGNGRVRYFAPSGRLYTLAGGGGVTGDDIPHATFARIDQPTGLAVDGARNFYVTEQGTGKVRRVSPNGRLTTFASLTAGQVGALASDVADRLWVAEGGRVLLFRTTVAGQPPVVAYEAPGAVITGLAYDQANTLYVSQSADRAPAGSTDARVVRLLLDAQGVGSAVHASVTVAGREGNGDEAAYLVAAAVADATTQRLAIVGPGALAIDLRHASSPIIAAGALLVGNSFDDGVNTPWGQVLRLEPK